MITYVDTSSLLKIIIDEPGSEQAALVWDMADVVASVALVVVEGRAALASAQRAGRLDWRQHQRARQRLSGLVEELAIVEVTDELIEEAAGLAEEEALRGYDAVHLSAALVIGAELLTSADTALCEAARRRGLHVSNPLDR